LYNPKEMGKIKKIKFDVPKDSVWRVTVIFFQGSRNMLKPLYSSALFHMFFFSSNIMISGLFLTLQGQQGFTLK
jgi:hypothetical protein